MCNKTEGTDAADRPDTPGLNEIRKRANLLVSILENPEMGCSTYHLALADRFRALDEYHPDGPRATTKHEREHPNVIPAALRRALSEFQRLVNIGDNKGAFYAIKMFLPAQDEVKNA